jgi:hypothetical protein
VCVNKGSNFTERGREREKAVMRERRRRGEEIEAQIIYHKVGPSLVYCFQSEK